jgi:hypothetical protein
MIHVLLGLAELIGFLAAGAGLVAYGEGRFSRHRRARLYARCLSSIDELERELFPEWFPKPSLQPTNLTQIQRSPYAILDAAQQQAALAKSGLHKSALEQALLYGFGPGRRWIVDDPQDVQLVQARSLTSSAISYTTAAPPAPPRPRMWLPGDRR